MPKTDSTTPSATDKTGKPAKPYPEFPLFPHATSGGPRRSGDAPHTFAKCLTAAQTLAAHLGKSSPRRCSLWPETVEAIRAAPAHTACLTEPSLRRRPCGGRLDSGLTGDRNDAPR